MSGLTSDVLNSFASDTNGDTELHILLKHISLKCPSLNCALAWFDGEECQGGVLHQLGLPENMLEALETWVEHCKFSRPEMWSSNLEEQVSNYITAEQGCCVVTTSVQESGLFGVAISVADNNHVPSFPSCLLEEIRNILPVALVMHRNRLKRQGRVCPSASLIDRDGFISAVESEIEKSENLDQPFAVAIVDLDRFKFLNDAFGPLVADEMFHMVVDRVRNAVSPNDLIARLGCDELAILFREPSEVTDLKNVGGKLINSIRQALAVNGYTAHITASIGVAVWSTDIKHLHRLIRNATSALRYVKRHGKDGIYVFDKTLVTDGLSRIMLEDELDKAVDRQEFYLVYQPRFGLQNHVKSAEALIRWKHPTRGTVPPSEFISIAEESVLIEKIGDWVLGEVCRQLHDWKEQGTCIPRIAVNVSPKQLMRSTFITRLEYWMRQFEISPHHLEIEITETALMEYGDEVLSNVNRLRDMGIQVAVDDFGTGYSSLEILRRFPTDYLKIDRSFVQDLNSRNKAIISMIIRLAHSLESKAIAEGVETVHQRDFLITQGCDEMQGYLYSRPLSSSDFWEFMQSKMKVNA